MGRSNESFNRRERERNKKLKADAKRERRQTRAEPPGDDGEAEAEPSRPVDESAIIERLGKLTASFDAGELEFEEYERQRADLLAQLLVD